MSIVRITTRKITRTGSNFAKGKKAVAICQRSGMKFLQKDMVFEPGTGYFVHKSESDGKANLVTDPLNYFGESLKKPETTVLRYSSPDVPLSLGTVVSATALVSGSLPPNANFYAYPGTSVTTDEDT